MNQIKRSCTTLLAGVIALTLIDFAVYPLAGLAKGFGGTGRPVRSGGGASRGGCPNTPKPLTVLAPIEAGNGGWTTAAYPTFWVYVPYKLTAENSVEFTVRDEQAKDIYQTKISGAEVTPGIASIALPKGSPPLKVGKTYTWYLQVNCSKIADRPATATGWIKRVELDAKLKAQATQGSRQQRSAIYVDQLIWYDALTLLGEGLRANPDDRQLASSWTKLLQLPSVGLDKFTTEPLSPCCTPAHQ